MTSKVCISDPRWIIGVQKWVNAMNQRGEKNPKPCAPRQYIWYHHKKKWPIYQISKNDFDAYQKHSNPVYKTEWLKNWQRQDNPPLFSKLILLLKKAQRGKPEMTC